ncbi:rho guanine nucleotide exchange factor 39 [Hyperolius riggenbachi]|uniref:rho guanine nucleotide exchange factor 39 n=1 Tax=Hyperolius riggenbachi TaxID=752182 RepID=UPI0035A29E26
MEATQQAVQTAAKKVKSFARFKKLQESRPEFKGQSLEKLLYLPLHRAFKYRHYLKDLVENILPGSRECVQLNGALQAISDLCDHIEDIQQHKENQLQLQRVQKLLKGRRVRILSPGRRYIREGWLSLVPPSGEDVKHRMLFLFSDVLAVTSPCHPLHPVNAHKFSCLALYPLRECQVERVLGHTQSQGGLISLSFRKEKLLLMSDNQQDLNSWFECLVMAVRKLCTDVVTETRQPFSVQQCDCASPRVSKRPHEEAVREDSGIQGVMSQKRMRMGEHLGEDEMMSPQADSGWSCAIL